MQRAAFHVVIVKIFFFVIIGSSISLWAADITAEELIAKHLASIGTAEARKSVKSRVVQAPATYRILTGGTGAATGKFVFAAEGQKSDFLFKVSASGYMGEQFICDGNKTSVAGTYPDKRRSEFGDMVLTEDIILRENLFGGVLSPAWALLDVEARKAKLRSDGIKKIDGKELLAVEYRPKKTTDLEIFLYFDPQTYQHILTVYKFEPSNTLIGGESAMASRSARRYRVDERFGDFRTTDGLVLPHSYDVRFTLEGERGFAKFIEWEMKDLNILNNQTVDPRSFQVK
jgi:hypothetical protein